MILTPEYIFKTIECIHPDFLAAHGIKALVLDVDNTLTTHGNPIPAEGVPEWIAQMQEAGVQLAILSNNNRERVEPFARALGLDFVAMACKPLPFGVARACRRYSLRPEQAALIGDQVFTDMISGNLGGVYTILVEPYRLESGWFFRLKRRLEKPVIRQYQRRKGERE